MRNTYKLLSLLTEMIPPRNGASHNITLRHEGGCNLVLVLGDMFLPFYIYGEDLDRSAEDLAKEVVDIVRQNFPQVLAEKPC